MNKENILKPVTTIALFDNSEIRKVWHNDEWRFSIIDICNALVWSNDPWAYWRKLKQRLNDEESQVVTNCHALKIKAIDGKMRETDCANTQWVLRVIQSIPSSKAEPFKQWLANLGNQSVEEANDPELWMQRARERAINVYKSRGMSEKEIKERLQSIDIRHDYTDELKARGISWIEYWILTNISYWWAGKTAKEYKELKWLNSKDNLRDHMTRPKMLLTKLSEKTWIEIAKSKDAKWFNEVQEAVKEWANVARRAREDFEEQIWKSVLDTNNRLTPNQQALRNKTNKTIIRKLNKK